MKRRVFLAILLSVLVAAGGCGGGNWSSGDRVLVAKFLYDTHLARPDRWDVVVFKFPRDPVQKGVPKNYIKRLLGLPGELLAILFGNIYVAQGHTGYDDSKVPPLDLWRAEHMNRGRDPRMLDLSAAADRTVWDNLQFKIQRKPLPTVMAMRRIVNDNDFQPKTRLEPRWAGETKAWVPHDSGKEFRHAEGGQELNWLRYRHLIRVPVGQQGSPQLITDFEGYNNYSTVQQLPAGPRPYEPHNWVGDLMLEARVEVGSTPGQFIMELAKGVDRFQAVWDLGSGDCTLYRITRGKDGKDAPPVQLARQATDLKAGGAYDVRFANIDARLTVWVNGRLPFGDGHEYTEPEDRGPQENDLRPASLGVKGAAVSVKQLKLWRDTYYTLRHDVAYDAHIGAGDWSDPAKWGPLQQLPARVMYTPQGHYLCMGDNSPQSSDSREWGTVPERLMLGRALLVYYPFTRAGRIK